MQKVWKQIGLPLSMWLKVEQFMNSNHITTYGKAIEELFTQNDRFRFIMRELEAKAQESQQWKDRAEAHIKESDKK